MLVVVAGWLVRWDAGVSSSLEFSHAFYGSVCAAVESRHEYNLWTHCYKIRLAALITSLFGMMMPRAYVTGRSCSQLCRGTTKVKRDPRKGKKDVFWYNSAVRSKMRDFKARHIKACACLYARVLCPRL